MATALGVRGSRDLLQIVATERRVFAAKLRIARAALDLSQTEFAARCGLTQRSVHKLEQGDTEPRRSTVHLIEQVWRDAGIEFQETAGGFTLEVRGADLDETAAIRPRAAGRVRRYRA